MISDILQFPIPGIRTSINTMLELNKQKQTTTNSETLEQLNQRNVYTDDKINKLVYHLYELTDEEIKIVENK